MSYHTRIPIYACAHQEVATIGKKFEDLYEIDVKRVGDELCCFLKQIPDIAAPQRAPPKRASAVTCFRSFSASAIIRFHADGPPAETRGRIAQFLEPGALRRSKVDQPSAQHSAPKKGEEKNDGQRYAQDP
jgi:hypothetical protein